MSEEEVLFSAPEVEVTRNRIVFEGSVFQISNLSTVDIRDAGRGASTISVAVLGFGLLVSALSMTSSEDRVFSFCIFLLCLAGIFAVKAKPPSRWEVYTKIGLDFRALYRGQDEAQARAVYSAILKAMDLSK